MSCNVLAVFAHPDDESYGPGATLAGLAARGHRLTLLTFTRGEASTLGVELAGGPESLAAQREQELRLAAAELGVVSLVQHRYPDGGLAAWPRDELVSLAETLMLELRPSLVITFGTGGISGHPDHIAATEIAVQAARQAAERSGQAAPVYGWAMPGHIAAQLKERLGRDYPVTPDDRIMEVLAEPAWLDTQWRAVMHHRSQHSPPPWPFEIRREVQAGREYLECLLPDPPPVPDPLLALLGR